ncbi:T9SS type A sorting domain-containing protein [Winogradskyella forsetii]|uniref:T9SS type A sorting domain-containing protein n=1 Tax=Winogradskyella forsetii TaxID=2686077 RepID=UPI0015BBFA54|nr:T9SS type A sorting domain-containing protein [Winogradskyella forsetii]
MKKITLISFILITAISYSQTVSIPDPNFEQALIDLNIDNSSPTNEIDGFLNITPAVTGSSSLNISAKGITDLTGIDQFSSLETLSCENNDITTVDFSSNLLLTHLFIYNNNLESLDLSQNSNLEVLWCQSNEITQLLLPTNSVLNSLECHFNNLSTINLSNSTALEKLRIQHNNLTNLDLSSLVLLEDLDAFDNGLETINLDNCASLQKMSLRNNNLTKLEIENKPSLFRMLLQYNELTSLTVKNVDYDNFNFNLNLQGNTNLSCVEVTDPDYSNANWDWLSLVTYSSDCSPIYITIPDSNFEQALIDLNIDSDGIINGQVLESDVVSIQFLNLFSKNISDLTGIEAFESLEGLYAFDNNLTSIDISNNALLTDLVLSSNALTEIDLTNNPNLTALTLSNNQIESLDLSSNSLLEGLYVQNNVLTTIEVSSLAALSQIFIDQNDLVELDLSQNSMLSQVSCPENNLLNFNIQNGNNTNIGFNDFNASLNPNLECIEVDDVDYSVLTWINVDSLSSYSIDCAPINDDCSFATSITLGQDTPGTTVNSKSSVFNPACQQEGIVVFDVWYQFIAPASGSVTMTLGVPIAVAKVAIYEDCMTQNPLACAQDELQINNLSAGQTYFLQVWLEVSGSGRLSSQNQVGSFVLNVQDSAFLSTGLDNELKELTFYPNPAEDKVIIAGYEFIDSYQIFDITGKMVLSNSQIKSLSHSIDISLLSKGIYMLRIKGENKSITKKLLIK